MIKATFYVPQYYNTGRPVPERVIRIIQDELIVRYGGFTLPGAIHGAWRDDDGQVYHDTNLKFELAIDAKDLDDLRAYLRQLKGQLKQKAIYLEINDQVNIEFL